MDISVDASSISDLLKRLEVSPKVIKEAKRQAFEAAAPRLKAAVDAQIGGSGRVRSWQEQYVGSKGGYAAARPKAKTWAKSRGLQTYTSPGSKRYAVGYITNAINSGHRTPSHRFGQAEGLRGYRVNTTGHVSGKGFYEAAQAEAEQIAQEAGEQILQALIDHLEG